MARALIIGCGNPLRSDDGVAWRAAEELRRTLPSVDVEILCVHQLGPELAKAASRANTVIFLDATTQGTPGAVTCTRVCEEAAGFQFSHHFTPAVVMALTRKLYGVNPQAFAVSVCGEYFNHGEGLSQAAAAALPELVRTVSQVLG